MNYRRTKGEKRRMAYDGYVRMSAAIVVQAVKDLKKIRAKMNNDEFITQTEIESLSQEATLIKRFLRDTTNPFIELLQIGYPVLDEGIARVLNDEGDKK